MVAQRAGIVLWRLRTANTPGSQIRNAATSIQTMTNFVSPAPFSAPDIMTSAASNTCHAAISTKSVKPREWNLASAGIRARSKKPEQMVQSDVPYAQLPEWFRAAVAAVGKGPSAINRQPVVFHWRDGAVTATLSSTRSGLEYNDLGIAKRHFEIAASAGGIDGRWGFGDGAAFTYEP